MASFLFYQLEYKILFDVDCVDRAELLTAEAADAYRSVDLRSLFHLAVNLHFLHLDRLGRADIGTSAASDTLFEIDLGTGSEEGGNKVEPFFEVCIGHDEIFYSEIVRILTDNFDIAARFRAKSARRCKFEHFDAFDLIVLRERDDARCHKVGGERVEGSENTANMTGASSRRTVTLHAENGIGYAQNGL